MITEANFIGGYYDGVRSREEAQVLHLDAGQALSGIEIKLAVGGQISGRVTSASSGEPVAQVNVCARSQTDYTGHCDRSDANGDYTIKGLLTDSYWVKFKPEFRVNYFARWYEESPSKERGELVPVVQGSTATGIDQALNESAGISGRVIDPETHGPARSVEVCTLEIGGNEWSRCNETSEDGNYVVGSMTSGEYLVVFSPERQGDEEGSVEEHSRYLKQYYQGASSRADATPLTLTVPELHSGIDAELALKEPIPQSDVNGSSVFPMVPLFQTKPRTTSIGRKRIRHRRRWARFWFRADLEGASFECRLDRGRFAPCVSPRTYGHLSYGPHLFEVRASIPEYGIDPTPARFGTFRIRRPHQRKPHKHNP